MAHVFKNTQGVTVSYPVREQQRDISTTDYFAVRSIGEYNKVRAIKFVRLLTGLGLYESKQIVDTILEHSDVLTPEDMNRQPATSLGELLRSKLNPGAGF